MYLGRRGSKFGFGFLSAYYRLGAEVFRIRRRFHLLKCPFIAVYLLLVLGLVIFILLVVPLVDDGLKESQVILEAIPQLPSHSRKLDPVETKNFGNLLPVPEHAVLVVRPGGAPEVPQVHHAPLDRRPDVNLVSRVLDEVSKVAIKDFALSPFDGPWGRALRGPGRTLWHVFFGLGMVAVFATLESNTCQCTLGESLEGGDQLFPVRNFLLGSVFLWFLLLLCGPRVRFRCGAARAAPTFRGRGVRRRFSNLVSRPVRQRSMGRREAGRVGQLLFRKVPHPPVTPGLVGMMRVLERGGDGLADRAKCLASRVVQIPRLRVRCTWHSL